MQGVSIDHEYVLVYHGGKAAFRGYRRRTHRKYSNPDNDSRGPWMSDNLVGLATKERHPNLHYGSTSTQNTGDTYPCTAEGLDDIPAKR